MLAFEFSGGIKNFNILPVQALIGILRTPQHQEQQGATPRFQALIGILRTISIERVLSQKQSFKPL